VEVAQLRASYGTADNILRHHYDIGAFRWSDGLSVALAWGYTVLRVIHSIWQATVNTVSIRFMFFLLSTLCLTILAIQALIATI
jgi:hypothetical protein